MRAAFTPTLVRISAKKTDDRAMLTKPKSCGVSSRAIITTETSPMNRIVTCDPMANIAFFVNLPAVTLEGSLGSGNVWNLQVSVVIKLFQSFYFSNASAKGGGFYIFKKKILDNNGVSDYYPSKIYFFSGDTIPFHILLE